jgi:hypothetical protein
VTDEERWALRCGPLAKVPFVMNMYTKSILQTNKYDILLGVS